MNIADKQVGVDPLSLEALSKRSDGGRTVIDLPKTVQAGWARLRPAGEWKKGYFDDILQEHFGIQPKSGGITTEACPACGGHLYVEWSSCVFHCSQCGWHGGLRQVKELAEDLAKEERHQGEQRRAEELLRVIAAGGITMRREVKDHERSAAVVEGLGMMSAAETPVPVDGWSFAGPEERARKSIKANLEGFRRCGEKVLYQEFEHKLHGNSYQPVGMRPCNEPGHEECGWWDAVRELGKWVRQFDGHYPQGEVLRVVEFSSPGLGYTAARRAVNKLKKRKALRPLLGCTVGFVVATEHGYAFFAVVRIEGLGLIDEAVALWHQIAGESATVRVREVEPDATALELAAELRCRGGQALALLVYHGKVSAWEALRWRAEELESRANHVVFGPGFRVEPPPAEGDLGHCPGPTWPGGSAEGTGLPYESATDPAPASLRNEDHQPEQTELPGTFSDNVFGLLGENALPASDSQGDAWEPCQVCGEPACGQRRTGRSLHWRRVAELIERAEARERADGIVVSLGVTPPGRGAPWPIPD